MNQQRNRFPKAMNLFGPTGAVRVSAMMLLVCCSPATWGDEKPRPGNAPPVAGPKFDPVAVRRPFDYMPAARPGAKVLAVQILRFETKEGGEPILAKVILVASHPPKVGDPRIATAMGPSRILGTGFEIDPPPLKKGQLFEPDLIVEKTFVDRIPGTKAFMVNLGDVRFRVATTREPPKAPQADAPSE